MRRILSLFLAIAVITSSNSYVYAADSGYDLSTKYVLQTDGTAEVEVSLTTSTEDSTNLPTAFELPIAGQNPTNAVALAGENKTAESVISQDSKTVSVKNFEIDSSAKTLNINLKYKTQLAKKYGSTLIFDVAKLNYGELKINKETIVMQAVAELGAGIYRGPEPEVEEANLGDQTLTWTSAEGQIDEAVGVLYGESSLANYVLETEISNSSWWWRDAEVVLPPDTNQQNVVLDSIEPKPKNIRLDQDGNIIAQYNLRPKQKIQVKAVGEIKISNYTYALGGSSGLDNIPSNLKDSYTATNEVWNGDTINSEVDTKQPVSKIIESIFDATVEAIPDEASSFEDAQKWSNALIGELRTAGIPARLLLGQSHADGLKNINPPQPFAWVEAYVPATGWITLDPMAERAQALFGSADVERITLVMRGEDPGYPPNNIADFSFNWQSEVPEELTAASPTLISTSNMILPGVSIITVDVQMGQGTIVDDTAIDVEGFGVTKLGSLAPLETSTTNLPALGAAAFAKSKVTYGLVDGDSIKDISTETTTKISYLPMIIIFVVIVLLIVLFVFIKRRSNKKSDSRAPKSKIKYADDDNGLSIDNFDFDDDDFLPSEKPVAPTPAPSPALRPMQPTRPIDKPRPITHQTNYAPKPQPPVKTPAQSVTINSQPVQTTAKRRKPPRLIQ